MNKEAAGVSTLVGPREVRPEPLFARIAHPTDLTKESEFAFFHALRLAVAARSKLDILHVDRAAHIVLWEGAPSTRGTLERWGLSPHQELLADAGGDRVQKIAAYGKEPIHPILEYIDENLPDLMVLATHRRGGLDRLLHKEIAQKLARSRAVTTLFVPYGDEGFVSPTNGAVNLRSVVVPVDWLPAPQAAVDMAAGLAAVLGCDEVEFTLLHVSDNAEDFPALDATERPGWNWVRQSRSGDVVDEILQLTGERQADLVVMVTRGHDGFLDALRGSTTERVLQRAPCPVLAVPAV